MPNPPDPVGYFAVILPQERLWQGFYLIPQPNIGSLLADLRSQRLYRDGDESLVRQATPGIADVDQRLFGGIQASLVDRVEQRDVSGIATFSAMIAKLADCNYFWVEKGRSVPEGTVTRFSRLNVTSIERARTEIIRLPQVMTIEMNRLMGGRR